MAPPGDKFQRNNLARNYEPTRANLLGHVTRAAKNSSGQRAGHFGLIDDWHAVDEDVFHSLRQLVGILEGGDVMNGCRIEDDDVGAQARLQNATVRQAHALRRQRGEFADSVFEGELVFFADYLRRMRGKVPYARG